VSGLADHAAGGLLGDRATETLSGKSHTPFHFFQEGWTDFLSWTFMEDKAVFILH